MSDPMTLTPEVDDLGPPHYFADAEHEDAPSGDTPPVVERSDSAPPQEPHAPGRIPCGVTFEGTIMGSSAYEVHGTLEGSILLDGSDLLVKEGASVTGTVAARNAVIAGRVSGEIDCPNGCVTFSSTARCDASLAYGELVVERGAKVNAQLRSTGE